MTAKQIKPAKSQEWIPDRDGRAVYAGDTVLCVDAEHSFHRLQNGARYVASAAFNGQPTVDINGAYHSMERFRKVSA